MSLIKSYASKTNNFSLIPASCVKPVVAFIQLIGNQQGYLNLVHYLRYLHISTNHRLIKANLKRDGERHNLLPVPSDIRVYLSAWCQRQEACFALFSPADECNRQCPSSAQPSIMLLPFLKFAKLGACRPGCLLLCSQSGVMVCPGIPLCSLIFHLLPSVAFGTKQLKSPSLSQSEL